MVRPARTEDLAEVLRLCGARAHAELPIRAVEAARRKEALLDAYRRRWRFLGAEADLHVLVREQAGGLAGYAVLVTGLTESITGDPQALLYDHAWESAEVGGELLGAAEARAGARGARYLVAEVAKGDAPEEEFFASRGYAVEICRIARRLDPQPQPDGPYQVRRATAGDQLFVIVLNSRVSPVTLPAGRDLDPGEVAARYLEVYLGLDLEGDPRLETLIVQQGKTPVGYLMLKTGYSDEVTGEALAYIYDLAIEPEHWGKRATQRIMREAEARMHARGVAVLLGDISAANPRALKTAIHSLGYTLEQQRWARGLGPSRQPPAMS